MLRIEHWLPHVQLRKLQPILFASKKRSAIVSPIEEGKILGNAGAKTKPYQQSRTSGPYLIPIAEDPRIINYPRGAI
jgi:hypothetical protein